MVYGGYMAENERRNFSYIVDLLYAIYNAACKANISH
jgi:hypothetical protein